MQFSQLYHSMANVKSTNVSPTFFACASSYDFRDIQFLNILSPESRSRSRSAIFAITPFDRKCQVLQMSLTNFCASSYRFRDLNSLNVLPSKSRSKSRSATSAITPFDGKLAKLKIPPTNFCARSYRFRDIKKDIKILNFLPSKVGQCHGV